MLLFVAGSRSNGSKLVTALYILWVAGRRRQNSHFGFTVSVGSGCYSKNAIDRGGLDWGRLTNRHSSPTALEAGGPGSMGPWARRLARALPLVHRQTLTWVCPRVGESRKTTSAVSLPTGALIPSGGPQPRDLITLQRPPHWEFRLRHVNCGGNTNIHCMPFTSAER